MSQHRTPHRYPRRTAAAPRADTVRCGGWQRRASILVVMLLVASVLGYLGLANDNATAGYELRSIERKGDVLREETRRLDRQVLAARTMDVLASQVTAAGFVPVAHVEYLVPGERAVARVP
ncbi:hypothetical protein HYV74_00825 [Candidatus Uhrbacteria bacterium]|nr:hypothetical protein [Candidatus Uhrbacteria bacterium]